MDVNVFLYPLVVAGGEMAPWQEGHLAVVGVPSFVPC